MWIRVERGGGVQPMWILFKFYNGIKKFANMDKGVGVERLSIKCGYRDFF